jgi:diacylglycerol kinase
MPPKIRPDVTVQQVGDESLILDLTSEQIHQLNATAAWILSQCDGNTSIESICDGFADYFSVDAETAARDVAATIEQLHRVKVIDLD